MRDRRRRGLATLMLSRPDRLNAIDHVMHDEIQHACAVLRDDGGIRVVVLTGEGRAFSSGNDLKPAKRPPAKNDIERRHRVAAGNRTADAIATLPQVTIAAVNGLAVGGGVVLAACCDLRLAARSAWFSIPEVDLDLPMTWNSLPRLMRELGPARTKELVMTCDRFSADDAERWGFVNHVYDDGRLLDEARALAEKLLAKDELALATTKAAANALANLMVPAEATYSDPELLLLADAMARRRRSNG
ncbi:MAG: enoyl-CoA hydratase/isomerase family protein [Dehalococcoidia bacterium]